MKNVQHRKINRSFTLHEIYNLLNLKTFFYYKIQNKSEILLKNIFFSTLFTYLLTINIII